MTIVSAALLLISILAYVAGQVLLKRALNLDDAPKLHYVLLFATAIGCLTVDFFLWLELLRRFELSYIFPYQALTIVIMCLGARVFLKERISPRMIVSTAFIVAGIGLVATT